MIETKDLTEFMKHREDEHSEKMYTEDCYQEYCREIAVRLRAFDKLKEAIVDLLAQLSTESKE